MHNLHPGLTGTLQMHKDIRGFSFFFCQCCEVKNLVKISKRAANLVENTLKNRYVQNFSKQLLPGCEICKHKPSHVSHAFMQRLALKYLNAKSSLDLTVSNTR
jgi:hypothetical protein